MYGAPQNSRFHDPEPLGPQHRLEGLLQDAIGRTMLIAEPAGIRAILIHPVDEEAASWFSNIHRRARIRAAERGTSLSAAVREFLIAFAGGETEFERRKRLQNETLASIGRFRASDRLNREDVHDRALRWH